MILRQSVLQDSMYQSSIQCGDSVCTKTSKMRSPVLDSRSIDLNLIISFRGNNAVSPSLVARHDQNIETPKLFGIFPLFLPKKAREFSLSKLK